MYYLFKRKVTYYNFGMKTYRSGTQLDNKTQQLVTHSLKFIE